MSASRPAMPVWHLFTSNSRASMTPLRLLSISRSLSPTSRASSLHRTASTSHTRRLYTTESDSRSPGWSFVRPVSPPQPPDPNTPLADTNPVNRATPPPNPEIFDPTAPAAPPKVADPSASSSPAPPEDPAEYYKRPSYELTFTCKPCGHRSSHVVSKQAYHYGTTVIRCPGCKDRHVISDHLKIFNQTPMSFEDILAGKGVPIKKAIRTDDDTIEFLDEYGNYIKGNGDVSGTTQ